MAKTITVTLPTIDEVEFSITAEQCDIPVRGNAIVSGDDDYDKKVEDEILERLNDGDVWAWATVCVEARWKGHKGTAYLGSCCYQDQKDFMQEDGYYPQMKEEAYDDLIATLEYLAD